MAHRAILRRLVGLITVSLCVLGNAEEGDPATNLAASAAGGTVVAVSSQVKHEDGRLDPQWQVANAFDGIRVLQGRTAETSLGWATNAAPQPGQPEWVVVTFGPEAPVTRIGRLGIDPATPSSPNLGRWVRTVELQVSSAGENGPYHSVGRFLVLNEAGLQRFDFPPVPCRYVRLLLLENHGSDRRVELGEIEIHPATEQAGTVVDITRKLEHVLARLTELRDLHKKETSSGYGPIAGENEVIVPSTIGLPEAEARRILTDAGLRPAEAAIGLPDTQIAQGSVIAQDLPAGSVAPRGAAVQLTVSRGPEEGDGIEPGVVVTEDPGFAANFPGTGKRRFEVGVTARGQRGEQEILIRKSDDSGQGDIVAEMTLDPDETREWVVATEGPVTIEVVHEGRVVFSKHYPIPGAQ